MAESANIARHLPLMAARQPTHPAVKVPRGRTSDGRIDYLTFSFAQLDDEVNAWVEKLSGRGVARGDRVLVMVRQGLPLIAAAFALFKLGAVPVIIDPGMGRKNFLACVARSKPRVLLGIPLAQITSHVFRSAFRTVDVRVWVSGSSTARLGSEIKNRKSEIVNSAPGDLAAVLFTSGSTGSPKGVCYEHGMFEAQIRLIRETYDIEAGEVDLPMLPIFALFNPALGMTTIVPEIDPSRPAAVDPEKIVRAILQEKVTSSFGSPTLWGIVGNYCRINKIVLPSLKRVLCAGAPVPESLWANSREFLLKGQLHSPYGATEALPITSVSEKEMAFLRSKPMQPAAFPAGTCVGHVVKEATVKIIAITDASIAALAEAKLLPVGQIGEVVVSGPTVTKEYDQLPEATARAKIVGDGQIWHRMGDAAYFDEAGRLWFCGRVAERVETPAGTLHTELVERIFRNHPRVERCALIGLGARGRQEAALVVQTGENSAGKVRLAGELRALALKEPYTAVIKKFFFHPAFPVDVRHNAKIHRLTLTGWAATATPHEPDISS